MTIALESVSHVSDIGLDMSEIVSHNYRVEDSGLVLFEFVCRIPDWGDANRQRRVSALNSLLADGGAVVVANMDGRTVGIASLESRIYQKGRMQLFSLHVDHEHRSRGVGRALFREIERIARAKGARGLYISAAPKKSTVDFYLAMGAVVTGAVERALFDRNPDDIHMDKMWA